MRLETVSQQPSKYFVVLLVLSNEQNCQFSEIIGFNHLPLYPRASQKLDISSHRCIFPKTLSPAEWALISSTNADTHSARLQSSSLGISWWEKRSSCLLPWSLYCMINQWTNRKAMILASVGALKKRKEWGFPDGPVVKTLHFHCRGHNSIPGQGTEILQAGSSCELSKMQTCIPSTLGMSEIAACPPSPIAEDLQLYHLPALHPPPVRNSSCLFTWCQPLYASCCTVPLYFSRYCTVRFKVFAFCVACFLMNYLCEKYYKPIAL